MVGGPPTPPMDSPRAAELLERLEDIFLQEGFRRVRIGELAARLHCSRRTLYTLAPSKEELFLRVLDLVLRRIDRAGRAAVKKELDPRRQVTAFIEPGSAELREATPTFFADIASLPAAKQRLEVHQASRRDQLGDIVRAGLHTGEFRNLDADLVAEVMMVAYRAATDPPFLARADLSLNESVRQSRELLLEGLLHPDSTAPTA